MSEEKKQRLKEYQKKYRKAKKSQYTIEYCMLLFMLTKQTTTHQLGTTHQTQRDVAPTCCYQDFPGS